MATKIGVLNAGQAIGRPAYHVPKAEADQRVLSGAAERITVGLIRMLGSYGEAVKAIEKLLHIRRMKLPSHELPRISTKGPFAGKSVSSIFRIMQANHLAARKPCVLKEFI